MLATLLLATALADEPTLYAPLTVSGTVTNEDGTPAADVTVYLASDRVEYRRLAETKTDADGRYEFDAVNLPYTKAKEPRQISQGKFDVFAYRPGSAIAWDGSYFYFPDRPAAQNGRVGQRTSFSFDEPIVIDLKLEPPAPITGRLSNDRDEPIAGALIDIRDVDKNLDPDDAGSYTLTDRSLSSLNQKNIVPRELKTTKTDADGRFTIDTFPASARLTLWIHPDKYPTRRLSVVTAPGKNFVNERGWETQYETVAVTIPKPTYVEFRVLTADTSEPVVGTIAYATDGFASGKGYTDATGRVELPVYAGDNNIFVMPLYETPYLGLREEIILDPEAGIAGPVIMRLPRAAEVRITAVGADTGKPVPDLWVWRAVIDAPLRDQNPAVHNFRSYEPATRISHINRRKTDAEGRVTHWFTPGRYRIGLAPSKNYNRLLPDGNPTEVVDLKAGETTEIRLTVSTE